MGALMHMGTFTRKSTADAVAQVWGNDWLAQLDNSRMRERSCFGHMITDCSMLGHDVLDHYDVFPIEQVRRAN